MRLATVPAAALCACSLLLAAAGCNKSGNTTNKTLVNTSTTTTTSNASKPAASPQPTAQATPTGTDVGRSLKASKPEDAAQGLFNAWKAKDRAAASKYASSGAINTLFNEGSAEGLEFQGCYESDGDFYNCAYTYEGGSVSMMVAGSDADGYKVTEASFIAD